MLLERTAVYLVKIQQKEDKKSNSGLRAKPVYSSLFLLHPLMQTTISSSLETTTNNTSTLRRKVTYRVFPTSASKA